MLDSFCAATEIIPDLASVHTHTRFLWRGEAGCADLSRISDWCSYFSVRKNLFQKYHNTLFCLFKILHKHCFQFLLGLTIAPREMETFMLMQNFGGTTKSIMVFFWKRPIGSLRRPNIKRNNSSVIWFSSTMLRLGPSNSSEKHGTISYNLTETRGEGSAVHRPNTTKQVKSRTNKKQQGL